MDSDLIYDGVLRMVLWGEPKEEIYRKLEVNGFRGDEADKIYQRAMDERISSIRIDCRRKIWIGLGAIVGSLVLFFLVLNVFFRAYPILLVGALYGIWKLGDGISRYFLAPGLKGSIADED